MTEIFVSKKIAKKLKEIGFRELCFLYYYMGQHYLTNHKGFFEPYNEEYIYAPTYEQVFKWFRERLYLGYIKYYSDIEMYACLFYLKNKAYFPEIIGFYETYEESRDELILKLIELYQNK